MFPSSSMTSRGEAGHVRWTNGTPQGVNADMLDHMRPPIFDASTLDSEQSTGI
jgi:hypothetical protein